MMAGNGLKNLQCSDTNCWEQGRQCGSASKIRDGEEPTYESKQDTHIEREIGTKESMYSKRQQLQITTNLN